MQVGRNNKRIGRKLSIAGAVVSGLIFGKVVTPAWAGTPAFNNLGTLGWESLSTAINDAGQVTGSNYLSITASGYAVYHAFLYTGIPGNGGTMADLGTLGGISSQAFGMNSSGQIVGNSNITGGGYSAYHAFLYSGTPGSGGTMSDLGTLGGTSSSAYGINSSGQIVGTAQTTNSNYHAFLYSGTPGYGGSMIDLGTFGGASSRAYGINDSGEVVGDAQNSGGSFHGFLYSNGSMADLGENIPNAINNNGQMAGVDLSRGSVFLYSGGTAYYVGNLGSTSPVLNVYGMNSSGEIVGSGYTGIAHPREPQNRAFLYTGTPGNGGQLIDLDGWFEANDPAAAANLFLYNAQGITDSGLVTGYAYVLGQASFAYELDTSNIGDIWSNGGSGNWSNGGNWMNSAVPQMAAARVNFANIVGAGNATITLDASETVGAIAFINSYGGNYTIAASGGSKLTIDDTGDAGGANPMIGVTSGKNTISAPIVLADGVGIYFFGSSSLTIGNSISGSGPILVSGAGTLSVATTGLLNSTSALSIVNGSKVALAAGAKPSTPVVQTVASLSFDNTAGSELDIGNNEMIITGTAPPAILADIIAGNVFSSLSNVREGVGYMADGGGTEVRFTFFGDTNLDGSVNFSDLLTVATDYGSTGADWAQGDFNYDGTVNFSDLLALASDYGQSLSPGEASQVSAGFAADWELAVSETSAAVPEPGMGMMGIGVLVMGWWIRGWRWSKGGERN